MRRLVLALVLLPVVLGCSGNATGPKLVMDAGTVRYQDLEGGFYAILGDQGGKYDPRNLPEEMKVEGLRVSFVAQTVPDAVTYHMWGQLIELRSIERIR